ncbi:MAG: class I SAM-dependent methyltransferase [Acetobacterales bacterium]
MKRAQQDEPLVDFGYRQVSEGDKTALVRGVFERVAGRYDLMNDLMSLGVHRLWKEAMAASLSLDPGMRVLDVAGGTGDIALRMLGRGAQRVTVSDINPAMLAVGQERAERANLGDRLDWLCADAESLPLPDRSVDVWTCAFGLRNVTRLSAALAEARRVLRPGGRFLCLEFSRVEAPGVDWLYDAWSFGMLPRLGRWVADDEDAYRYLAESIRRFPPQERFAAMIEEAGLERVTWRNLSAGIAALHSGWRL